ncbi:hypothetical protein AX14_006297 [Amanita brunnescens Koide BX004]|nr:hypothetical protein AX14_006297 [Amanita brunnescens Koide BX004]
MANYTIQSVRTGEFVSPFSNGVGSPASTIRNPAPIGLAFSTPLQPVGDTFTSIQGQSGLFAAPSPGGGGVVMWGAAPYTWRLTRSSNGFQLITTDSSQLTWSKDLGTPPFIPLVPDSGAITTFFSIFPA